MMNVKVTVSGPGGCIDYEVEVIRRALEAEGLKVNVIDPHPFEPNESFANIDELLAHCKTLSGSITVDLIANHIPWGG